MTSAKAGTAARNASEADRTSARTQCMVLASRTAQIRDADRPSGLRLAALLRSNIPRTRASLQKNTVTAAGGSKLHVFRLKLQLSIVRRLILGTDRPDKAKVLLA